MWAWSDWFEFELNKCFIIKLRKFFSIGFPLTLTKNHDSKIQERNELNWLTRCALQKIKIKMARGLELNWVDIYVPEKWCRQRKLLRICSVNRSEDRCIYAIFLTIFLFLLLSRHLQHLYSFHLGDRLSLSSPRALGRIYPSPEVNKYSRAKKKNLRKLFVKSGQKLNLIKSPYCEKQIQDIQSILSFQFNAILLRKLIYNGDQFPTFSCESSHIENFLQEND